MRYIVTVLMVLVAVAILVVAFGSFFNFQPGDIELRQYPVLAVKKQMMDKEVADLGLRRVELGQKTPMFIHYRYGPDQRTDNWSHWHYGTFRAGTEVAMDRDGRPWYLINGANRLFVPSAETSLSWPSWLDPSGWHLPWWWPFLLVLPGVALLGYGLYRLSTQPIRRGEKNCEPWEPIRSASGIQPSKATDVALLAPIPAPAPEKSQPKDSCKGLIERVATLERGLGDMKTDFRRIDAEVGHIQIWRSGVDELIATSKKAKGGSVVSKAAEAPAPAPTPEPLKNGLKAKLAKAGKAAVKLTDEEIGARIAAGEMTFDDVVTPRRGKRAKK